MKMPRRPIVVAIALACAIPLLTPRADAAEVIDQISTNNATLNSVRNGFSWGQTFVPQDPTFRGFEFLGLGADHPFNAGLTPGQTITATLYEANGFAGINLNLGAQLGQVVRQVPLGPPGANTQFNGIFDFGGIDVSGRVNAATDNALVVTLEAQGGFTGEEHVWYAPGTSYGRGQHVTSNNGGATWTYDNLGPNNAFDMAFRTWSDDGMADVLDQENGFPDDFTSFIGITNNVGSTPWLGQTFSATQPTLTAVEFGQLGDGHPFNSNLDGEPITVEIWSTAGGLPDTKLGEGTRTFPLDPPAFSTWSGRFEMDAPIDVSSFMGAGQLAMLITLPDPTTAGEWHLTFMDAGGGGPYADGNTLQSNNQGGSWGPFPDRDLIFRTYGLPEPATLSLLAVGGLLMQGRRRRSD